METIVEAFERETERFLQLDADSAAAAIEESFTMLDGTASVMISAPHSVSQWRNGRVKSAENSTGALAVIANEKLGCPAIFKTGNAHDDANYDETNPYRDMLAAYVANHDVKLLLDLHQLSCERPMEACVGTGRGRNVAGNTELVDLVVGAFRSAVSGEITIDDPFAAEGPHTIARDISSRCNIPCFQIELNSRLLLNDCPDYDPDAVFAALARIVRTFEGFNAASGGEALDSPSPANPNELCASGGEVLENSSPADPGELHASGGKALDSPSAENPSAAIPDEVCTIPGEAHANPCAASTGASRIADSVASNDAQCAGKEQTTRRSAR